MRHEARRKKNKRFGELSLVYGSPRAAICVASSDCLLWKVDRVAFNFPLAQAVNRHNANVMTVVNYLQKAFTDSGERNVLSKILRKKQKKGWRNHNETRIYWNLPILLRGR
jgi:CRP-like cAMP-binding protein